MITCARVVRRLAPSCGLTENYSGGDGLQPPLVSRQLITY